MKRTTWPTVQRAGMKWRPVVHLGYAKLGETRTYWRYRTALDRAAILEAAWNRNYQPERANRDK